MPKLSLSEAIRYLFPAFVGFFYLFLYDPTEYDRLIIQLGTIGLTASLLVASLLFYFVYRAFVYEIVIIWFQDRVSRKTDNYRTYLKRRYGISTKQAVQLFTQIRERHFGNKYVRMQIWGSAIHFLYLAGILALPFLVMAIIDGRQILILVFVAMAAIFIMSAFVLDRRYEEVELGFVKTHNSDEFDRLAKQLFEVDQKEKQDA